MKSKGRHFRIAGFLVAFGLAILNLSAATTNYVWLDSPNPTPPYSTWETAAHVIQDAVDVAEAGSTVLVTNGVYAVGSRDVGYGSSRVTSFNSVRLESVNGPVATTIDGGGSVRCVYLGDSDVLSGFTLTKGYSTESGGGGAYGGTLYNCTLIGNSALYGGGAILGRLSNCILKDNWANWGGGAHSATLSGCTLTGNSARDYGGGVAGGTALAVLNNCTLTDNSAGTSGGGADSNCRLTNCIVYLNTAADAPNYSDAWGGGHLTLNYCLTTPLPTNGVGNIDADPKFLDAAAGDFRLRPDSPCIDAGTNLLSLLQTDITGNPRPCDGNGDGVAAFDMGAYEFRPSPMTLHVSVESTNPVSPYTSWATAATVIQDAVDVARDGDTVLVGDGVYDIGSREGSRVVITNSVTLESVNGASATLIVGDQVFSKDGIPTNGIRCVLMTDKAVLRGFTLTNGWAVWGAGANGGTLYDCILSGNASTRGVGGGSYGGGAIWCTLYNTTLTGNSAVDGGGGAAFCTLHDCTLRGNSAIWNGGGAENCTLHNCKLDGNAADWGGGAHGSELNSCLLNGNSAVVGGGANLSTLYGCNLTANSASDSGGGAWGCGLYNCILTGNVAPYGGWATGWGCSVVLFNCTVVGNVSLGGVVPSREGMQVWNSILYNNTSPNGIDYGSGVSLNYCCTSPLPTNGVGNIAGPPLFMDMAAGDFRLREDSPCIDAGTRLMSQSECADYGFTPYSYDPIDILGNTRFIDGNGDGIVAWDIGAYEFNSWKAPRFGVQPQLTAEGWKLNVTGAPNKWARLERSGNLTDWEGIWSGWMGAEGVKQVTDADQQGVMFYRVVVP